MVMSGYEDGSFSKTEALKFIAEEIGFPKPAVYSLSWFFEEEHGIYVLQVDLSKIKQKIREENLISKMAKVKNLPKTDPKRQKVIKEICMATQSCRI